MDTIKELIRPELLVLIPVLYFVGIGLKNSQAIKDSYIPILLGLFGIVLSLVYLAANCAHQSGSDILSIVFAAITQGILCAGCSVYVNQIAKQSEKRDAE